MPALAGATAGVPNRPVACAARLAPLFPFEDPRVDFVVQRALGRGFGTETLLKKWGRGFIAEKTYRYASAFELEAQAWLALAWLLNHHPPTGFNYPNGLRLRITDSPGSIGSRIQYYPGRTVEDLVSRESDASVEIRERVRSNYLKSFARIKATAELFAGPPREMIWNEETGLPWAWIDLPRRLIPGLGQSEGQTHLPVKPDNIVVDPWTLEMTIFDPY